jgi:hypothetical protein
LQGGHCGHDKAYGGNPFNAGFGLLFRSGPHALFLHGPRITLSAHSISTQLAHGLKNDAVYAA